MEKQLTIVALASLILIQTLSAESTPKESTPKESTPKQSMPKESSPKEHPDVTAAKRKYLTELRAATEPVQKRYMSRLESLQKDLTRRGDLEGAIAAKTAIDALRTELNATDPASAFAGIWSLKYSNGVTRTYAISRDGTVHFREEQKVGKIVQKDQNLLLSFGGGKIERLSFDYTLDIEHYLSQEDFTGRRPNVVARGTRQK